MMTVCLHFHMDRSAGEAIGSALRFCKKKARPEKQVERGVLGLGNTMVLLIQKRIIYKRWLEGPSEQKQVPPSLKVRGASNQELYLF